MDPGQLAMFEVAAPRVTYLERTIDVGLLRRCSSCGRDLPIARFARSAAVPDGLNRGCLDCSKRFGRITRGVHPDDAGLMPAPTQHCELCGRDGGARGIHLDHDHLTGRFRGWLCNACNTALGHLQDDPDLARAAARYLEERAP